MNNQQVGVNMEEENMSNGTILSVARQDNSKYKYTRCCHNVQLSSDLLPNPVFIKAAYKNKIYKRGHCEYN